MQHILNHLETQQAQILSDIESLVRLESPSRDAARINHVQDAITDLLAGLASITRHPSALGDVLHAVRPGNPKERIVLLAHADTVYPVGTWDNLWRSENDLIFGPGVYDMKAGIVQAIHALRAIQSLGLACTKQLELLVTPDEEIASEAGRPHIERLAQGAQAVLVLEPPHLNGDLKIARKGVGGYHITVHGKAAHQGTEPENGRNAIVSAAHLISEIIKLQDLAGGTTLGPNIIAGGSAMNVVADQVQLEVDLRVWSESEAGRIDHAIRNIAPLPGTRHDILGGLNRPPMEPSEGSWALLQRGQEIAKALGFEVGAARVGGGSDGNFTAKIAPTLDGFGAYGKNAHQRELEQIHVPSLVPRTALLAGMLLD